MTKFATFLLICFLVLSVNSFALAKDNSSGNPSIGAVVLDILVHRPLGLCGTILGASAYAISLPVTAHFKKKEEVKKILVMEPYDYTFKRPLGEK
jgi:hypothetical protein